MHQSFWLRVQGLEFGGRVSKNWALRVESLGLRSLGVRSRVFSLGYKSRFSGLGLRDLCREAAGSTTSIS